jgi:hypothetical protein
MSSETISLVAFLILSIASVTIFAAASRHIFANENTVRTFLAQQLPRADVNYLLSTDSVDTNNVNSLIHLSQRIRTIRSPVLSEKGVRNIEVWIIISLMIAEQRTFQRKTKGSLRRIILLTFVLIATSILLYGLTSARF